VRRAVEKRNAYFDGGRTELVDWPESGSRRDTGEADTVHALVEGEGYLSHKKIAQTLDTHHKTVKRILGDDLNMSRVIIKWMPHLLNNS
jgi:hypothetical protein